MADEKIVTLYIIQGFIGAGKSTYSKKLASETGAVHLNPDEWVTKFYDRSEYMQNWDNCFEETVNRLWQKAKEDLQRGESIIFDMGFWHKKDRDFARRIAGECNCQFKHIYLHVPDEVLKKRIIETRPPEWAEKHLQNFERNKSLFEEPEESENAIKINNF